MLVFIAMEELARQYRTGGEPDERLFALVGKGDGSAFETLYRETERAVYALALSILKNPDDAQDVTQETYLKVRAAAHLYVPQGKPLAWLFTITKNLCRDFLRTQGRTEPEREGADYDLRLSYVCDPIDRMVLEGALKALGEEERQVVLLHAVSGLKHREIARDLGQPLSTVLSRYSRAIKKLQRYLNDQGVSR